MKPSSDSSEPFSQSEHWFRILAETCSAAILIFRETILLANHAAVELTGYSEEELLELPIQKLLPVEDLEQKPGLVSLVRKDGRRRLLRVSNAYIQLDWQPAALLTAVDLTEQERSEVMLQQTRERFLLAQKAARWITWEWTPRTDRLRTSSLTDPHFGFEVESALRTGTDFLRIVHAADRDRVRRTLGQLLRGEDDLDVELRCRTPRGDRRWIALSCTAVRRQRRRADRVIGVARDVTEQKLTESALFEERDRAFVTLSSITDGVIRTDSRGIVDYLNPVAQRLTGWSLAESYGHTSAEIYLVVDEETEKKVLDPVQHCLHEQREVVFLGHRVLIRRDGTRIPIHDSAAPILDRDGRLTGTVLIFRDLSQMRRVEEEIQHLASHDPLTGLANRREFEHLLAELLIAARGKRVEHALCHLDLDSFKLINDTCGHSAGDQLLQQIAGVLKRTLRPLDLIARVGIDEFAILFRDCSLAEATTHAEAACAAIHRFRFHSDGRTHSPRVSAGLVPINEDPSDPESLLGAADAACYVAKESGGGRLHVFEPGDSAIAERSGQMQWVSRIQRGFDEQRFCLWEQRIQPLEDNGSQSPLSELFIRLVDDEGNIVSPGNFIPAAERYGLIDTIDKWVVKEALHYMADHSLPERARFAINISGQSLGADGFLDHIVEQIEETGIDPQRILFEITETSAIANLDRAMRFISVLKTMGCLFVLDDFGQGLSSFGYLKSLPLDFIKIDGAFVREMVEDPIQAALVTSIRDVGQVMGLQTIAESVENEATYNALTDIGVDYVQGYFLDRPKPLTTSSPPPIRGGLA